MGGVPCRGAPLEMSKSNLRWRRGMQQVSAESWCRRGLLGYDGRGLTAMCSEKVIGHGRRDARTMRRTACSSWGAHDDRRGVSAAMGSKVSGESADCSAPLLPVFELRMRRSAGLAPTRPSNLRHRQTRSTLKGFFETAKFLALCKMSKVPRLRSSSLLPCAVKKLGM